MGWLNDAVNVLQLISLPILIVVTLYGAFSAYLTDFWRGFMLGALVVLLPMLVLNIYLARRHGREKPAAQEDPSRPSPQQPAPISQQVQKVFGRDELQRMLDQIGRARKSVQDLASKSEQQQENLAQELIDLSDSILELRKKYDPVWDSDLRGSVIVIYEQLNNSGSAIMQGKYHEAQEHFDVTYEVARHLMQSLEPKSKTQ